MIFEMLLALIIRVAFVAAKPLWENRGVDIVVSALFPKASLFLVLPGCFTIPFSPLSSLFFIPCPSTFADNSIFALYGFRCH